MKKVLSIIFVATIFLSGITVSANNTVYGPEKYNGQPLELYKQGADEYNGQPLKSMWQPEEYNGQPLTHFTDK